MPLSKLIPTNAAKSHNSKITLILKDKMLTDAKSDSETALSSLTLIESKLKSLSDEAKHILSIQAEFGLEQSEKFALLDDAISLIENKIKLWHSSKNFETEKDRRLNEIPFVENKAENIQALVEENRNIVAQITNIILPCSIIDTYLKSIDQLEKSIPVLKFVTNKHLKAHHKSEISTILGLPQLFAPPNKSITLNKILKVFLNIFKSVVYTIKRNVTKKMNYMKL